MDSDEDIKKYAAEVGIKVLGVGDLPLPPPKQMTLPSDASPVTVEEVRDQGSPAEGKLRFEEG